MGNGNDSKRWCDGLRVLNTLHCALAFRSPWPFDLLISNFTFSSLPRTILRWSVAIKSYQVNLVHSQNWKTQTNLATFAELKNSEELGFVELKLTTARGLQGSKRVHREIRPRCGYWWVWVCLCVGLFGVLRSFWTARCSYKYLFMIIYVWLDFWLMTAEVIPTFDAMRPCYTQCHHWPTARSHSIPSQDPLPSCLAMKASLWMM